MAIKENIEEAEDFDFAEYNFKPQEVVINDKSVIDYTTIEHDKIYLVNKKDILSKPRPSWIPDFDIEGLVSDNFLPVCVKDFSDGSYFVQSKIKTGEKDKLNLAGDVIGKESVFEKKYYKMSPDLLAASVDYYLKYKRAELKENNNTQKVSLPRALKTMPTTRYLDMAELLSFCKDISPVNKGNNPELWKRDLRRGSVGYKLQNDIIFNKQWQPLLDSIKDKKLDMNLQKQDFINTYDKGEETSYGKSNRYNTLYEDYGVKIKKQNGSTFSSTEKESFKNALDNCWNYFGALNGLAADSDLTLSYADNCNQHARKAVGLYRYVPYSGEKSIGVSFFSNDSESASVTLAHEITHWLDSEKGLKQHHHFASDIEGTLENKIASKFKQLVRQNVNEKNRKTIVLNNNKIKLGDYWYRTCECLARAVEEHYALTNNFRSFEDDIAYLPKKQYEKEIEPLVKELLEENRNYFKLEKTENIIFEPERIASQTQMWEVSLKKPSKPVGRIGNTDIFVAVSMDDFSLWIGDKSVSWNKEHIFTSSQFANRLVSCGLTLEQADSISNMIFEKDGHTLKKETSIYYAAESSSENLDKNVNLPLDLFNVNTKLLFDASVDYLVKQGFKFNSINLLNSEAGGYNNTGIDTPLKYEGDIKLDFEWCKSLFKDFKTLYIVPDYKNNTFDIFSQNWIDSNKELSKLEKNYLNENLELEIFNKYSGLKAKSYYDSKNTKKYCHDIKKNDGSEEYINALNNIVDYFVSQGIFDEKSVLVPAPQHTGIAEYTKDIAEHIAEKTGSFVADIMHCREHEPLYDIKKSGIKPRLKFYIMTNRDMDQKLSFWKNNGYKFYYIDNNISTGVTFNTAMFQFYNGGYETNPPKLIPAPYAIGSKTVIEHIDDFYFVSNEDAPLWEKQILKLAKLSEKYRNGSEVFNSFIKTVAELKNQSVDFCKKLYSGYDNTKNWFNEIYILEDVQSLKEKSLEFFKKYNLNCTLDNIGYGWIGSKRRDIIADVYYEHEKEKVFIGNITGRTARYFYEDCDTYYKSSESKFWDLDEDSSGFLEYYKNKENEIMKKENDKSVDVEQFEQTLKENIEVEYEQQSLFSNTDLNIEEKKDVPSVNIPETDKTRIFTVDNSALIASDRADFLSSLEHYKNGKKHSKDRYNIKQNLINYDMRPVSFIYEGRGYLGSSVYESFVCKKNDNSGYKYMLVPHNEEFYKDYNKLIISEKTYPEYKDCQNALIEELLNTKDFHEYEIENKEHHLYNIPQKYYDKFLKYIAENESEICQKAENFISSNSSWTEYKDKPIEDKIRIFLLHDKENPVDFNTPEWVEKFEKLEIEFNDEITIKENKPETKNTQNIKKEIQLDKDSAILNQLGFIEIKDDIEIKNTIDTFKNLKLEMKTFYNDINYDNCKIFKSYGNKKDNENKTPVYIIYYNDTFAVMQDKSLDKPGKFIYHDEYFPFLTSLLLTLGKKTNLSQEETEKIAFSKYPDNNFQLTAEKLLSLNVLSDSDKDFYKTLISDNFFFRSLKKLINDNTKDYKHSESIESDTKKTFEERFINGDFDNIFQHLGNSNYRHLGRPLYDEIHFEEIKSLWIELFSDGVPDSIKKLENQWYEKIEQGNLKAIENKQSYIKQASEASDEKLLKYYDSFKKYDHEEGIVHNDYLFMTQVINCMGKNSEFHSEPLHGFYFYQTPELAADRNLRLQVIEKELEERGLMNYAYGWLSDELIELNEKIRAEEHIDIIFKTLKEAEAFSKLDLEKNKSVKNISKTVKPVTMKFNFEKNIAEDLSANNIEEKNTMNKNTYLFPEHFFKDVNEIKKYSSLKYLGTYNFGTDGICQVVFGNEKELETLAEDYGYELHPDFFYEKADLDIEDAEIVADLEMVDFENKGFKYKDMFGITRQVLPPKEQLENNVCEIIYGLENAMQDNPDEFEPRTLEELRKEVCSEIFDMVSDGGGSVDYADNICAHLKFLGNKYIYSVIDRIGKECGIVKEETKDVEKDLEKKPYTFIVKDTGEFTEDFEPVTGLTAEEAVDTYIKLRDKGYYPGFTFHIPDDLVFGENSEHGAVIALNHNDKINFKIMGDTFINQLKNADERSRNYINVYKELYEAISKKGLPVELPQFVYDKEAELFNRWDYIVDNFPDYEHNSTITLSNDIAAYLDNGSVLSGEVDTIEKFNKAFSLNFENDQQLKEYGEQLDNAIFQCAKAFANNERSKEILFWQAEHLNFKDKVFTVEDIKRVLANIDSNMPYIKHHIAEKVKTLSEIKNIQDYVDKGFGVLADIDDIKRDFHTDNIEYGKWETPEDALLRRFMTSSFADNQMELYDISKVVINYMIDCSKEVLDARKATIDIISENLSLNSPEEQFKENKTPYIKLNWSESPAFREENKVYSVKEFNELLQKTDKDFYERKNHAVKKYGSLENYLKLEEEGKLPEEDKNIRFGYDKTDFKFFNIPDPGNPEDTFSYAPDRYDIGDGEGSVFDFVRSTCSHDDFIKALDNLEIELYYPEITTEQKKDIENIIKQESLNLSNNLKEKLAALDEANEKHNELHKKWLIESSEADAVDKLVNDSLSAVKNTYENSIKNVFKQFLDEYPFASKSSVKDSKLLQFAANEVKKMIINELHLPYRSALKDSELYNSTDWERIRKVYSLFPVNANMTDYVENILQEKCNEKGWSVSEHSENKEQLPEILFNKLSSRTNVWFKNQNKTVKDMLDYIIKIKGADFTVKEYADNSLYIQGYDNGLKPRGKMKLSEADITYLYKNKESFSNKWIEKIENHIENQYQYYKKNFYDAENPNELLEDAEKFWNEGKRRAMEEIIKNQKEKIFIKNTLEDAEKLWDFLHNKEKIIPTPKMLQVLIKGLYANDYDLIIENNKIYIDDPQLKEHNEADLFTIVEHSDNQNALTDEEYDIYNTIRNTLINKNINKNNIEIKPVTLENILSIMEIVPEVEDDGSILLYDQQRKEYIDNDSGFENTEDADSSLKYKNAAEIFERLDSYIGDYIINDLVEQLDKAGAGLASSESLEDICRIYRNELEKGNKNLEIGELEIAESILNPSTVIMPEKYNQINNKNKESVAETKTKSDDDVTLENFDHEKFFNIYHKAYDKYYNNFGDDYDEKLHTEENENCENFDFLMKHNNLFKETIISLVQNERKHDPFSSDREFAAVVKAFIEMGIDIDYSIENKTEQSKNVNTNNADIAIEADAKARKLGYNFRYNSDNPEFEICEIYRNSDGALLAEYGEGGFSYPDGVDEDMKISDDVLKDVISLAEIFYTSVKEYPLASIAQNEQNLQKHDNTVEEPGNNILNETSENKSEKEKIKDSITVNDIASENLSSFINEYFKDVHNPSFKSLSVDEKIAVVKDMSINVDLQGEYYDDTDIHPGTLPLSFIKNKIEYEGLNKDYPYFNLNNNGQKRHYDEVIKEYNDSLSEKINHISEKLDFVVNKTSYSSPFDIIENAEKGRVNIKFNPAKNNPYFEDIVKELKEHGWRYAPSSKVWYPVKIGDSRNFVKELYDKYEALILSESVIKNSNSENINPYAGIKFFDRNYNEAEDFSKYFSDNHTEISLEDAKTILAALNHKEDGIVENRSDRLGLDSENNLVIVSKNKNEINIEKTDLNTLLKIAKDMSHSTYHDCCVALEEHLKKDELSKDSQLQSIFKEMYENCRDDALEIKNNMDQVFEKYYKSKKMNIENISSEKPVIWQRTSSNGMEYSLTPDFENWIACRPFDYSDRSGYLIMKKTEKGLGTKELLHTEGWNKEGACCHCIDLLIRDEQFCEKIGVSVDTNFFEKLHKLSVIDSKNGRDVLPDLLPNRMLEKFGYKYKPAKQAEHSQELPIKPLANNDSYGDDIIKNLYQMGNGVYQVSLARNFEDGVTSVGEFFLVNKSVASLLPENISNFLESSENDYCSISTSDPNVPYVLRQLIKQDIIPPKDTEFLLNLDEYIRIHPLYLAVENFFPVFPDNLEEKTKELVEINLRLGMSVDPKFIGKSMINMISVANNDILDSLLKTKGCTSPENTEKYFASLISPVIEKNQGIKNERKINKNDGYPPRGDN